MVKHKIDGWLILNSYFCT